MLARSVVFRGSWRGLAVSVGCLHGSEWGVARFEFVFRSVGWQGEVH